MGTAAISHQFEADDDYVVNFAGVEVNLDRRLVSRDGRKIELPPAEHELLPLFVLNPGRDLPRDTILDSVWGYLPSASTRTVDAHVLRLRQKLEPEPNAPKHFLTMHRVGYRFRPSA